MLIDLHAHSKGISKCCKIFGNDMVILTKDKGLDGIVLTNHYDKSYLINNDKNEFAERYVNEYRYVKECGDKINFKVFFGIEVTLELVETLKQLVIIPNTLLENLISLALKLKTPQWCHPIKWNYRL